MDMEDEGESQTSNSSSLYRRPSCIGTTWKPPTYSQHIDAYKAFSCDSVQFNESAEQARGVAGLSHIAQDARVDLGTPAVWHISRRTMAEAEVDGDMPRRILVRVATNSETGLNVQRFKFR